MELLKFHLCVAHAQFQNQERPGSYTHELNNILRANNLPNIIVPDDRSGQPVTGAES